MPNHSPPQFTLAVLILLGAGAAYPALARPTAPGVVCATYPDQPLCRGTLPPCATCHTAPPDFNVYGAAVSAALGPGARPLPIAEFEQALPTALRAVEPADADGDGTSNGDELRAGTWPGNPDSKPVVDQCPPTSRNAAYDVCYYDRSYVFRKVHLDFCGRAPRYAELKAFRQLGATEQDAAIHAKLDECLRSEAWISKDGIVWSMAHRKVKPIQAIKSGEGAGQIPLGDYEDDYALFVYTQTGDRDVRDVITANYYAARQGGGAQPTTYVRRDDLSLKQSVDSGHRAGMLTMRWFLVLNIMFTPLPRTAAAQAYRAYLGLDIGKLEGIQPIPNEPMDYDTKGVKAAACSGCHSTLDPLTYPFAKYNGLNRFPFGSYQSGRFRTAPEAGAIFGQPVSDLVEWARVAADSDAFAKATVTDYWHLVFGESPRSDELAEFESLWRGLMTTHQHRVERMLHALVRTEAYGVP